MKITQIKAVPKDFQLESPFKFASCTLKYLPYALIQIKTDEGITGYGECPAYWDPSGETQESAIGAVKFISEALIGKSPFQISDIMNICDSNIYGAFSAKCGLDMALYDIQGKKLNVPVYEITGGNNNPVKVNAVLSLTSLEEAVKKTEKFLENGYEHIKVKVGVDLEQETKVLDEIVKIISSETKLFVDANQGWGDYKTALQAIRKLEKYNLAWVEQPVKAYDWDGLKKLKERVDTKIMADESLYSYQDALKMAKNNVVDMFNIKLAKSGGIYLGSKIKTIADAANIPCVLGSMIESSLGMLADYHFAKSYKMETCGLSGWTLITNDFDLGLKMEKNELRLMSDKPGLGYQDEKVLEREFR